MTQICFPIGLYLVLWGLNKGTGIGLKVPLASLSPCAGPRRHWPACLAPGGSRRGGRIGVPQVLEAFVSPAAAAPGSSSGTEQTIRSGEGPCSASCSHPKHLGCGLEDLFQGSEKGTSPTSFAKGEGEPWGQDSWVLLVGSVGRIRMRRCGGFETRGYNPWPGSLGHSPRWGSPLSGKGLKALRKGWGCRTTGIRPLGSSQMPSSACRPDSHVSEGPAHVWAPLSS